MVSKFNRPNVTQKSIKAPNCLNDPRNPLSQAMLSRTQTDLPRIRRSRLPTNRFKNKEILLKRGQKGFLHNRNNQNSKE